MSFKIMVRMQAALLNLKSMGNEVRGHPVFLLLAYLILFVEGNAL